MCYFSLKNQFTMKIFCCIVLVGAALLTGCSTFSNTTITRTEVESYTIVIRDTIVSQEANNAPGQRDNGVVYPSTKRDTIVNPITEYDSTHERYYPNFLRAGVFEMAGFVGTGQSSNGIGGGLFGAYGLADPSFGWSGNTALFTGEMFRLLPYEWRLRWFRDAPNWTIGISGFEMWQPQADINKAIMSIVPLYVRKRYFLREQIPYITIQPTVGIGFFPSEYINLGATLDVGSLGGLNFHAYLGYIASMRFFPISPSDTSNGTSHPNAFPYIGLGISVLDFVNTVPETQEEWKYYKQSSLEVSGLNMTVIHSFSDGNSIFSSGFPTGIAMRIATVEYPLWVFGGDFAVGTSLLNLLVLNPSEGGLGILPIRASYRMLLLPDELTNEPFFEVNYYPSAFLNIGDKLTLDASRVTINVYLGYATGNTGSLFPNGWLSQTQGFSGLYLGIGLGFWDKMFNLNDLTPF